jgi:hypothetical protein
MIDYKADGGRELQAVVKEELKGHLEYSNDVLPLYIVVMLAYGNEQQMVGGNLVAFLGAEKASQFAAW